MVINFKGIEVSCEEFDCYMIPLENEMHCEINLLVDMELDRVEEIYSNPFLVVTENHSYVFSGYVLDEYYEDEGLVRIVCRK